MIGSVITWSRLDFYRVMEMSAIEFFNLFNFIREKERREMEARKQQFHQYGR